MNRQLIIWAAKAVEIASTLDHAADSVLVKEYESEVQEARQIAKNLRGHAQAVSVCLALEIIDARSR